MTEEAAGEEARQRWLRIEALIDAALELDPAERDAFLRAACGDDVALHSEVVRIIDAGEQDAPFESVPIGELAATLVAQAGAGARDGASMPRIGPYRVVREIGHGGMGTVFLAERDDGEFRRTVALKVVRRGLHYDPRAIRRFREERQTLAALQHPEIARLLDGGVTDDGLPYFAMEYVAGDPIDRYCDTRRLSIEQRLALFVRVCDAIAYAHDLAIIHRDIKPSNILVMDDGAPRLLDFGIAKLVSGADTADATVTRTGERLLTPEYASPEQVRGEPITPAADVYALGVLLFELLTGRRPFHGRGRTPHELERATLDEEPTRPSTAVTRPGASATGTPDPAIIEDASRLRQSTPARLQQRLRGDLDSIVLQALRKEPERRYPTAAELAADVRRHLDGLPVRARGDSLAYRTLVWARRHRRTVAAAVTGMVVGMVGIAGIAVRNERHFDDWMEARGLVDEVSTRSPAARRYYEDGLRVFARGQLVEAVRLFRSALDADSTFAMAAFYGSNAAQQNEDYQTARELLELSVRHVANVTERERLILLANHASRNGLPSLGAYADSLNTRFPSTALGALWSAHAALRAGDWSRALRNAERAVALDSLSIRENLVPCYACEALNRMVDAYISADSLAAAEQVAAATVRLMPASAAAWRYLATVHLFAGGQADSAYRRAVELDSDDADYAVEWLADAAMRRGDFVAADQMLRARIRTAPARRVERSLGLLIKSLRMQERWDDALEAAWQYRVLEQPDTGLIMAVQYAQVLLESGRPREAAALYDSISGALPPDRALTPEYRIWHQAHRADALAAAGDTSELRAIADTIRALAPASGNGRDAHLADHVDGLLLAARGDYGAAADAFRRAIFSWNRGYTRTNYELARALLRLDQPTEAVAALQPALRGPLEVNNSYITHTALRRLMAEAWLAAGSRDSAAVHANWVARATR